MESKDHFYLLLQKDAGKSNEIDLGRMIGLEEDETLEIIAQLLSEHSIEYTHEGHNQYRVARSRKCIK